MIRKNLGKIISIIIGSLMILGGYLYYDKVGFTLIGAGIALIGVSIELYIERRRDTTTVDGRSRKKIDQQDERTIFVNAKAGETTNYIMDFFTVIAFIIAKLLNVSLEGMIIILSLMILRQIISPIIKNYYEKAL